MRVRHLRSIHAAVVALVLLFITPVSAAAPSAPAYWEGIPNTHVHDICADFYRPYKNGGCEYAIWARGGDASGVYTKYFDVVLDTKRHRIWAVGTALNGDDFAVYYRDLAQQPYEMHEMETHWPDGAEPGRLTAVGVGYDSKRDELVLWCSGDDGCNDPKTKEAQGIQARTVYSLDLDTLQWSVDIPDTGPEWNGDQHGTFGRWQYSPQDDAFIAVNRVDHNAWLYHPATDDIIFVDGFDSAQITLPPAGKLPDYQLGGAYPPDPDVAIVGRDRADPPAPGRYSICYINGFQTQPGEAGSWPTDLILHSGGAPVTDPDWPEEAFLDTSSASKRAQIVTIVQPWIEDCADSGFDAVEFDNLDSYTRSQGLLTLEDNMALAKQFVAEAHRVGLAAAQKNTAEESAVLHDQAAFDFALSEECAAYQECERYTDVYGIHVIDIEYPDNLPESFQTLCQQTPYVPSMVLRDRDLVPRGESGYVFEGCETNR